ncbi:MAG: DNRLRE domain-containing protein [Phycisphaerae bacterium]|nr:DNRLRE domain-containing protein [Phycisphaerae bacterium]
MSHGKSCHSAAIVLAVFSIIASTATAEHAQTTLRYNPGQPGHTSTYDTYINLDAPTVNYNGNWYGHITRDSDDPADPPEKSTLVRFDLPSWVYDSSVTVHNGKLGLWVYGLIDLDTSYDCVNVGAYRINPNRDWVDSQATWNVFKGTSNWSTAGCENTTWDRVATADDTLMFTENSAINRYYEWTVTGSVNAWKGGAANRGWNMRVPSYDGGPEEGISVNLTESSTAANRPKLWLDWTQTPVADADGPYSCDYVGSVILNGGGSYERDAGSLVQWAWDLNLDGNYTDAYGVGPSLTWDYLVNTLGLTPGESQPIGLKVFDDDGEWSTAAYSTLYVAVPEPTTMAFLALGGLALLRRR